MLLNVSMISTAVKFLDLNCDSQYPENVSEGLDPIDSAIQKFKNHPSVKVYQSVF